MVLDVVDTSSFEELMRVGSWSIRRRSGQDPGLVFVNVETGRAQSEPPQEVLAELDMEDNDGRSRGGHDRPGSGRDKPATTPDESTPQSAESDAQFSRILLGPDRGMPLAMARDILAAIREDATIFDMARKRFSDVPAETNFGLQAVPDELQGVAVTLGPGEFSGVIGTEVGMQILLRVC
jgi:hypothetical protein